MPTLGELVVSLTADTGDFYKNISGVQDKMGQFGAGMAKVGAVVSAIGVPFALMAKSAIDNADSFGKMAQKAGTSVEFLSSMAHASGLADISSEALTKSLVKLSSKLQDAGSGSKSAAAPFEALGISAKNSAGQLESVEKVFPQIAEQLSKMQDGTAKTALAVDLFGKSGADLIPLLNAGAKGLAEMREESDRFGSTISKETAAGAERLNDSLTRVSKVVTGLFNQIISSPIVGKLGEIIEKAANMAASFAQAHPEIATAIGVVGGLAAVLGPVILAAGALSVAIGALSTPVLAVFGAAGAIGVAIAAAYAFLQSNEDARKGVLAAWESLQESLGGVFDALVDLWTTVADAGRAIWAQWGDVIVAYIQIPFQTIGPILKGVFDTVAAVLKTALGVVAGAIQAFSGLVTGDWDKFSKGILKIVTSLWDGIKNVFLAQIKAVMGAVSGFVDGVTGLFTKLYDTLVGHSIIPDLMTRIGDEFTDLDELMVNPVRKATEAVVNSFSRMFDDVVGKFTSKIPVVGTLVNDLALKLFDKGLAKALPAIGLGALVPKVAGAAPAAGAIPGVLPPAGPGLGASLGAFFTNPITIGVGAAIGGALLAKHLIGRGRRAADDFGGEVESPFGSRLGELLSQFQSEKAAGVLTRDEALSTRSQLAALVSTYSAQASAFAALGDSQAKVVEQARVGKIANFGENFSRVFDDINASIRGLTNPLTGSGLAGTGRTLSASDHFSDAVDRFVPAVERLANVPSETPGITVTIDAPLTVNYDGSQGAREQFDEFIDMVEDNARGYGARLTAAVQGMARGIVTA